MLVGGVASAWWATREWVVAGEEGDFVTPDRLVGSFGGDVRVPVVECGAGVGGAAEYGEEPRREMALGAWMGAFMHECMSACVHAYMCAPEQSNPSAYLSQIDRPSP
jgi:hypothetical protein